MVYNQVITQKTSSVAAMFGRHGMTPPASNPTFDLKTGVQAATKMGNLSSKFGFSNYSRT